jgi:hypothetical protein
MVLLVFLALDDVPRVLDAADRTVQDVQSARTRVAELAPANEEQELCVEHQSDALVRLEGAAERAWTALHASFHDDSRSGGRLAQQRLTVAGRRAQEAEARAISCLITEDGVTVEEPALPPMSEDLIQPLSLY